MNKSKLKGEKTENTLLYKDLAQFCTNQACKEDLKKLLDVTYAELKRAPQL